MSARKRVVLLARPGGARDRTEAAIVEAGAEVALALDPASASEADVRAAAPDVLLVILEPATEQVLSRFDGLLGDPGLEVIFEEAEVAARREGWEAARWARHLAAKLHGHHDVLPRAREGLQDDGSGAAPAAEGAFEAEMQALQLQVAAMPDVPQERMSSAKAGAVAIAAGVGGPDAVRQLLGALPAGFPRPVLLRQQIVGGQYDRLVRQMQRATALEVALAQPGDPLRAGTVHVMPDGVDVQEAPAGLVFVATGAEPGFAALAPSDSALLLLSGADPALVDRALSLSLGGGLALGQAAENCFDPAASNALVARGGEALGLAGLSNKLLQRWPA